MANIFGDPPTVYFNRYSYSGGVAAYVESFAFPKSNRGGRNEDFLKISNRWTDLDRIKRERIFGYRFLGEYNYNHVTNSELESFVDLFNGAQNIFIEFAAIPQRYEVYIKEFKHGLSGGLAFADSVSIVLEGVQLVASFPDPDAMIKIVKCINPGLIY